MIGFPRPGRFSGALLTIKNCPAFLDFRYHEVLLLQKPSQAEGVRKIISVDSLKTRHGTRASSGSSIPLSSSVVFAAFKP
jgi:hypothetical protein